MREKKLSERLAAVAEVIPACECLSDIGCDHAYLSIWAVENVVAKSAIASDVRPGPLARARKNVERVGLGDKIAIKQFPGAEGLTPGEADCILISGMGGHLTSDIISESEEVFKKAKTLVLEPQSDMYLVREKLRELSFVITGENYVEERGKSYQVIKAENNAFSENIPEIRRALTAVDDAYTKASEKEFTREEAEGAFDYFGAFNLINKNKLMGVFLLEKLKQYEDIMKALLKKQDEKKYEEIKKVHGFVACALSFYED